MWPIVWLSSTISCGIANTFSWYCDSFRSWIIFKHTHTSKWNSYNRNISINIDICNIFTQTDVLAYLFMWLKQVTGQPHLCHHMLLFLSLSFVTFCYFVVVLLLATFVFTMPAHTQSTWKVIYQFILRHSPNANRLRYNDKVIINSYCVRLTDGVTSSGIEISNTVESDRERWMRKSVEETEQRNRTVIKLPLPIRQKSTWKLSFKSSDQNRWCKEIKINWIHLRNVFYSITDSR